MHNYSRYAKRTGSYPQTRSYNAKKNGDFLRQVIDALFRLATMDWTWIFAVLRGTTYLQPTVPAINGLATADRSLGGVVPRAIREFLAACA